MVLEHQADPNHHERVMFAMAIGSITPTLRTCTKCESTYPETIEFFFFARQREAFETRCKQCRRRREEERLSDPVVAAKRKERQGQTRRSLYAKDPTKFREKRKRQYYADREASIAAVREWQAKNSERAKENSRRSARAWRLANPERERAHARAKNKRRLATPKGRLDARMRARLGNYFKCRKGSRSWQEKVGYSLDELKAHLERQFVGKMSWDNMGKWHIDHIVPLSAFSYSSHDDPEFKAAWALCNLRPLWGRDNIVKGHKRTYLL